jgi:hypothetical protein
MGVILDNNPEATSEDLVVKQWMPYDTNNNRLTAERSLQNILNYLDKHDADTLVFAVGYIPLKMENERANYIGDCDKVGNLKDAIGAAYQLAKTL